MALYTNDTAIADQSHQHALVINRLQMLRNKLAHWFMKYEIAIEPEKSEAPLIQGRWTYRPEQNLIMDTHRIPWKVLKYLKVS